MQRSSSAADWANVSILSGSQAGRSARADHGYPAQIPQLPRGPHSSLPACVTPSTWVPPIVPLTMGPRSKRRRVDPATALFAASYLVSGDSFHKPNSARYCTAPDARSVASELGPLDPLESRASSSSTVQTGACSTQVSFSRVDTQRAFRQALLIDGCTPHQEGARLREFLEALLQSLGSSLRDLIDQHPGLKIWVKVDVQNGQMFEERIEVASSQPTPPIWTPTSRLTSCSPDWERRCSSAFRTSFGTQSHLYWTTSSRPS